MYQCIWFFLTDKSRTVDDIIREVEDLGTNTDKEPRGFGLHRNPPTHKYGSDKGTDLSAHSNQISQKKLFCHEMDFKQTKARVLSYLFHTCRFGNRKF